MPARKDLKPRRGRPVTLTRRPLLSEEDLACLDRLRLPEEGTAETIRRLIRKAEEQRAVDETLRSIEARLARIEASGSRPAAVGDPAPEVADVLERTRAAMGGRFSLDNDEEET